MDIRLYLAHQKLGTWAKVGKACGLSAQNISDMKHGRMPLPPAKALRLCQVLGYDDDESVDAVLARLLWQQKNDDDANAIQALRNRLTARRKMEARAGIEPTYGDLQSPA